MPFHSLCPLLTDYTCQAPAPSKTSLSVLQFSARPWPAGGREMTITQGMPCTHSEVLDIGKYSNPSFGPFHKLLVPYQGFFGFLSI